MNQKISHDTQGHHELKIRTGRPQDAQQIADVERSAAKRFSEIPYLSWIAQDEVSAEEWASYVARYDTSFVALDQNDKIVGFLCSRVIDSYLHIDEVSVRHSWQGRGIGRMLIEHSIQYAGSRSLIGLTLTTYRDIPWNAQWYMRQGFRILDEGSMPEFLSDQLNKDQKLGLSPPTRVAMWQLISSELGSTK